MRQAFSGPEIAGDHARKGVPLLTIRCYVEEPRSWQSQTSFAEEQAMSSSSHYYSKRGKWRGMKYFAHAALQKIN